MLSIFHKSFNELSPQQLYDLIALRLEVFVVEQNCLYQDLDYKDQNATHFFCYDQKKMTAYARVLFDEDKGAISIGRVVTLQSHRKRGLSTALMKKMLAHITLHYPNQKIVISAQCYISHFYQAFGFTKTGQVYQEDGLPHIRMERMSIDQMSSNP